MCIRDSVCSAGILFIVGYNVVCGILRGLGDSKTPLYFVALACVINIVLDFILDVYKRQTFQYSESSEEINLS